MVIPLEQLSMQIQRLARICCSCFCFGGWNCRILSMMLRRFAIDMASDDKLCRSHNITNEVRRYTNRPEVVSISLYYICIYASIHDIIIHRCKENKVIYSLTCALCEIAVLRIDVSLTLAAEHSVACRGMLYSTKSSNLLHRPPGPAEVWRETMT